MAPVNDQDLQGFDHWEGTMDETQPKQPRTVETGLQTSQQLAVHEENYCPLPFGPSFTTQSLFFLCFLVFT